MVIGPGDGGRIDVVGALPIQVGLTAAGRVEEVRPADGFEPAKPAPHVLMVSGREQAAARSEEGVHPGDVARQGPPTPVDSEQPRLVEVAAREGGEHRIVA